jgi:hypothetical protein
MSVVMIVMGIAAAKLAVTAFVLDVVRGRP